MIKSYHQKKDFCYKRPDYRETKWETAIKVYTINQESKYLLIQGVPAVGASRELVERFALYGDIEEYRLLDEYPTEQFTEVYWIKYARLQNARYGKRKLDNRSFFGGLLHVCYAPEYETVKDTREKLLERKRTVLRKCKEYTKDLERLVSNDKTSTVVSTPDKEITVEAQSLNIPPPPVSFIQNNSSNTIRSSFPATTSIVIDNTLPRVPTQNATLPTELQNLSAVEVYPAYYSEMLKTKPHNIESSNTCMLHEKTSTLAEKQKNNDTSMIKTGSKRKTIIWNTPFRGIPGTASQKTVSPVPHCYSQEPGAWDPYKEQRQSNVIIPNNELDDTVINIRNQLSNTVEQPRNESESDVVCPLQAVQTTQLMEPRIISKQKKQDGRKRI